MIAGIRGNGSLAGLYPQYNSKKITPIKSLNEENSSQEDLSQIKRNSLKSLEDTVATQYQSQLMARTDSVELITYNEANPYEMARKTIEESLLVGMNFDFTA